MLDDSRPERKARRELHCPPDWVSVSATFFLTINCAKRGSNQLANVTTSRSLIDATDYYHRQGRWYVELLMLMPDHIHMLVSFKWDVGNGMGSLVKNWKRFTANSLGIGWQRDYFDHRIRSESDHQSTWYYIQQNPVRANLVARFDDWPFVWRPEIGAGW